jgi:hypothetical protein
LQEKKEALHKADFIHEGCVTNPPGCWHCVAREALRREIAREEEEEAKKRPTLKQLREETFAPGNSERVCRILSAVEKLAPHLKTMLSWSHGGEAIAVFHDTLASIVRLDP